MFNNGGGQWQPELIGDPDNHPDDGADPASGGVGGAANITDPDRHNDAAARHTSARARRENGWTYEKSDGLFNPIVATGPEGQSDKYYGTGLTQVRHPDHMPTPLYHGTRRKIEGDQIVPGRPGNFVKRMKHVYMTDDANEARHYAGPHGAVYEVHPTGFYGHRSDAKGVSWASEDPLDIVRKVPREESPGYDSGTGEIRQVTSVKTAGRSHAGWDNSLIDPNSHNDAAARHSAGYDPYGEWDGRDDDEKQQDEDEDKNWDEIHSGLEEIHRGIGVHLPPEVHQQVHDRSRPIAERAKILLDHVQQGDPHGDHGQGLGTHWTDSEGVADDFARHQAKYLAGVDKKRRVEANDFTHGHEPDEPDIPRGHPATEVILHSHQPDRDAIDSHVDPNGDGSGAVYGHDEHGESEIPLIHGASVPIKGISFKEHHHWSDEPIDFDDAHEHHDFAETQHHTAALETQCQTPGAQYHTTISGNEIDEMVDLPMSLDLDKSEATLLDADLHNAMELVLRPYFDETRHHTAVVMDDFQRRYVDAKPGQHVACPTCEGHGHYDVEVQPDEPEWVDTGADDEEDDSPAQMKRVSCDDCDGKGYHVRRSNQEELNAARADREASPRSDHAYRWLTGFVNKHEDEDPHPGGLKQPSCPPECTYPADAGEKAFRDEGRRRAEEFFQHRGARTGRYARFFHADPSCRVCATPAGHLAAVPAAPHPNPYGGHSWYHGTDFSPQISPHEEDWNDTENPHGVLRPKDTEDDYYDGGDEEDEENHQDKSHWNTDLGVHFAGMHSVAHKFADKGRDQEWSRIAHAHLHMSNPATFPDEDEFANHIIQFGKTHGFRTPNAESDEVADNIENGDHTQASREDKEVYLAAHPDRHRLTSSYRRHLISKGHDGVLYGNEDEGPEKNTCAIAFPETPVHVKHWEYLMDEGAHRHAPEQLTDLHQQQLPLELHHHALSGKVSSASSTGAHDFSWDEIAHHYPETYSDESDGEGISYAASHLAHSRPDDPEVESGESVDDLKFHHMQVNPQHIDHARHGGVNDHRVLRAVRGYQEDPEHMPPLILVKRHNMYQVADGHHRAEAAKIVGVKPHAFVADSPYPDEPFGDGRKAPFHGAKPIPKPTPRSDPKGQMTLFEAKQALNDQVPWCAHLYHGNCTYPGDKLPNGTILGIPQDRGPCPWKASAFQQAACPISAPGPLAVMQVSAVREPTPIDPAELNSRLADRMHHEMGLATQWRSTRQPKSESHEGTLRMTSAANQPGNDDYSTETVHGIRAMRALKKRLNNQGIPDDHPMHGVIGDDYYGPVADHTVVATHEPTGQIAGALAYNLYKGPMHKVHLSQMRTLPEHQGHGVGSMLVHHMARDIEKLPNAGQYGGWVHSVPTATGFYAKQGADFLDPDSQIGTWTPEKFAALREGHPVPGTVHPEHLKDPSGDSFESHEGMLYTAEGDYRMQHQAPDEGYGAPLHDVENMMPGFYDHPEHYNFGQEDYGTSASKIQSARGNPEKKIRIYRSLPADYAHEGFHTGDWVTTSKHYARQHSMASEDRGPEHDWPVISQTVPAKHLHTEGDVHEWAYNGPELPEGHSVAFKGGREQEIRQRADGSVQRVQRKAKSSERQTADTLKDAGYSFSHYGPNQHGEGDHTVVAYGPDDNWAGVIKAHPDGEVHTVDIDPEHQHQPLEQHMRSMLPQREAHLRTAGLDREALWHFTASWADVRNKAKRLRAEGRVRIAVASMDGVGGEVKGDHHIYETMLVFVPGSRKIGSWSCGCKWAGYTWGRSPAYARFEGRQCSHALAMQFEAQARGMFGRTVTEDTRRPTWMKQRTPVVVQYERPTEKHPDGRDLTRRSVPPGNMRSVWGSVGGAHELWRGLHFGEGSPEDVDRMHHDPVGYWHENATYHPSAGIHWSDHHSSAANFALGADPEGYLDRDYAEEPGHSHGIILHGQVHPDHIIDPESEEGRKYQEGDAIFEHEHPEAERTVREGAPIHITHVTALSVSPEGYSRETTVPYDHHVTASIPGSPVHEESPAAELAQHLAGQDAAPADIVRELTSVGLPHIEAQRITLVALGVNLGEIRSTANEEAPRHYASWESDEQRCPACHGYIGPAAFKAGRCPHCGHSLSHVHEAMADEPIDDIHYQHNYQPGFGMVRAFHGGQRIGDLTYSTLEHDNPTGERHYVSSLFVHPDYRRHGIASGMYELAKQHHAVEHSSAQTEAGAAWAQHVGVSEQDIAAVQRLAGTQDTRKHAPEFGEGVPNPSGLPVVSCNQCGGGGCGHCGGVGQVLSTPGGTVDAVPDQNEDAGQAITGDGIPGNDNLTSTGARDVTAAPFVSGVALKAADTGRILMIQRSLEDEKDPARGTWEIPGGHHEDGDLTSLHAAIREWQEEVGQPFPDNGIVHHTWTSPNGVYQGHVVVIPEEKQLEMQDGRVTVNPDDPKGDHHEQAAWWDIDHARKNPALRSELKDAPWKDIAKAGEHKTAAAHSGNYPDGHIHVQENLDNYRYHGDNYRLYNDPDGGLAARTISAHAKTRNGRYRAIGYLNWFGGEAHNDGSNIDGGVIHKVFVEPEHQHQGLASAMLDFARERRPDIRHSTALTEQGRAWSEKHAKKNPALRPELKTGTPWGKIKAAGDLEKTAADTDSLGGGQPPIEESTSTQPPRHSPSTNPASSGWATGYDPAGWNQDEVSPLGGRDDIPLSSYESTLHDYPEGALPSTDGDLDEEDRFSPETGDSGDTINGSDTDGVPDTGEVEPSSVHASLDEHDNDPGVQAIVARFQATAGAASLMGDSQPGGSKDGVSDSDIAGAAAAFLQKSALKSFTPSERAAILNEHSTGARARNFDDLDIEGTHYEALNRALENSDVDAADILIL
jgi:GNAT superfamily N-acetyltransferase/8-oxo-dGTP pyrophosphatase MutT (NUDIX family)